MIAFLTIFVLTVAAVCGQHGNPHGGGVPGVDEVNAAIVDLSLHYNDKLCLELLLVDCATHVTQGDEQICGSDGITYTNHCKFSHSMCEYLHADTQLTVKNHGPCPITTMPPSMQTTAAGPVATQAPSGTTQAPSGTTQAPSGTTQGPVKTTPVHTSHVMTTATAPTTTDPLASVLQGVFCQNAATISCTDGFQILCGTDGQLYPNQCEMSKAKCQNPSLTIEPDQSKCALP